MQNLFYVTCGCARRVGDTETIGNLYHGSGGFCARLSAYVIGVFMDWQEKDTDDWERSQTTNFYNGKYYTLNYDYL